MTTLNQASPDFIEFMYTGIDEAVSSIQDGDEFITFAIFQEGVERRMIRFVTENIEDGENVAIQQISAFEQKPEWALIVYDGFVTVNNQRTHAIIINAYDRLKQNPRFRIFPSLRFEYFLTLLKNAQFIIGNSSAGIREAPYYGLPIINIGTRQQNRALHTEIVNVDYSIESISKALINIDVHQARPSKNDFGTGDSSIMFLETLINNDIWQLNHQKQFRDI